MDLRKLGLWMVGFGSGAMVVGLVADALQHADDATLAQREGIFDLSSLAHATFFAGVCLAVLGLVPVLFGPQLQRLYERGHDVTVSRRLAQILAPIGAIALVVGLAAAASSSQLSEGTGTSAAETAADGTTVAADGHTHSHGDAAATGGDTAVASADGTDTAATHDHGAVIPGSADGSSPCEQASPTPASPGQVGAGTGGSDGSPAEGGHGERGMLVQQALTKAERDELVVQMEQARTVIDKYPTVKDAEAAGYGMSTPYVPCIGAHYTNIRLVPRFDPAAPSELLYDGTKPDSKIVGLSYLVYNPGGPPQGFAGANDHWHQHNANGGLCMKGSVVVGGESMTPDECAQVGGAKRELTDIWMVHAWVAPGFECSWGAFAGECPDLGGKTGGTAWDS
jgi:hypothetical protein